MSGEHLSHTHTLQQALVGSDSASRLLADIIAGIDTPA
jgi:hypothetical protein